MMKDIIDMSVNEVITACFHDDIVNENKFFKIIRIEDGFSFFVFENEDEVKAFNEEFAKANL